MRAMISTACLHQAPQTTERHGEATPLLDLAALHRFADSPYHPLQMQFARSLK